MIRSIEYYIQQYYETQNEKQSFSNYRLGGRDFTQCLEKAHGMLKESLSSKPPLSKDEPFPNCEYAYNRDKGKCKCCGRPFSEEVPKRCHHINNRLPIERINKVPNLACFCESCHRMIHRNIPPETDVKVVRKIQKYCEKLKT